MTLLLGIDTGGTYTDGVLLDESSRQVVATTKTLTTRQDLTLCILRALDALLPQAEDPGQIALVSISTTLATNAIAEGKGRPAALFLLGYDRELLRRFQLDQRLATAQYHFFQGGHDLYGNEQAPLDEAAIAEQARKLAGDVVAFAISGYFSPFDAGHEERAARLVQDLTGRPVVMGHELASRLNSVQRATTATLNASLLPILHDFIGAMRRALDERRIKAPLMVMRGSGALMSAQVASQRPVETVHSGPAASAVGGRFLAGLERGLVVDIGGTTTDIAVVDGGQVLVHEEGTTVGPYHTAVRAAHVRSIGLGGDSFIAFDAEDRLTVGPARVVPIAYLAQADPRVKQDLKGIGYRARKRPSPHHVEYWFLQRQPERIPGNDKARQALALLAERPHSLAELLERLELLHPVQFNGRALLEQEIIGRAAVTPTDLLHVTGQFAPWDGEAAEIAATWLGRLHDRDARSLAAEVLEHIAEQITAEIVSFVSGQTLRQVPNYVHPDDLGLWLFKESLRPRHPYLASRISLKLPIIGIGAPAAIFLPRVAELLGTELVLPLHHGVANALGAVVGSVMAHREAWIMPQFSGMNIVGYFVQIGPERRRFADLDEALEAARQATADLALADARLAGAVEPHVAFEQLSDGAESFRLRATAVGAPQLTIDN